MVKEFIRVDDGVIQILGLKFECKTIQDNINAGGVMWGLLSNGIIRMLFM